jgi:hypothetical protein
MIVLIYDIGYPIVSISCACIRTRFGSFRKGVFGWPDVCMYGCLYSTIDCVYCSNALAQWMQLLARTQHHGMQPNQSYPHNIDEQM